jgi:FkbM family methyltransferase
VISHLQWEALEQKVYEHPAVHVRAGDTVLNCGAHIGFFTRMALRAGARTVIAVEPEEGNIAAFRRNFTAELLAGSVNLVPVGLWSTAGKLQLQISGNSND